MKKVMISQAMAGVPEEEIRAARKEAIEKLESMGYTVVNSYFDEEWSAVQESMEASDVRHVGLWFMAKGIDVMSTCDAVYFVDGWTRARGCRVERTIAEAYGLELLTPHD